MRAKPEVRRRAAATLGLLLLAPMAHAQLSGVGDQQLIVGVSNLRGEPGSSFGREGIRTGDLNCDGRDDVIVMQPGAAVGGITGGTLTVIPTGSSGRPDPVLSFEWNQATAAVADAPETGDGYGTDVDVLDFDLDGCDDLFVGVPFEDLSSGGTSLANTGAVHAFRGHPTTSLTATGSQFLTAPQLRAGEQFGRGVAAMSFGTAASTYALFVGAPDADALVSLQNTGRLSKFVASGGCLVCDSVTTFAIETVAPGVQAGDRYGVDMLSFGNGARRFLALRGGGANALALVRELNSGPVRSTVVRRSNLSPTAPDTSTFAARIAAGDFDGSDNDIAILADDGSGGAAFEIFVLESTLTSFVQRQRLAGPFADGLEFLFVGAMAAGDFNGDGFDDLALGFPGADGLTPTQGHVLVLRGSAGGLDTSDPQRLQQGLDGLAGVAEVGDQFGADLASGDLNGDGVDDLVIGVPGQRFQGEDRGAVHLVYGAKPIAVFANGFEDAP